MKTETQTAGGPLSQMGAAEGFRPQNLETLKGGFDRLMADLCQPPPMETHPPAFYRCCASNAAWYMQQHNIPREVGVQWASEAMLNGTAKGFLTTDALLATFRYVGFNQSEVKACFSDILVHHLNRDNVTGICATLSSQPQYMSASRTPAVQEAALSAIDRLCREERPEAAAVAKYFFDYPDPRVDKLAGEYVAGYLKKGLMLSAVGILERFGVTAAQLARDDIKQPAAAAIAEIDVMATQEVLKKTFLID